MEISTKAEGNHLASYAASQCCGLRAFICFEVITPHTLPCGDHLVAEAL